MVKRRKLLAAVPAAALAGCADLGEALDEALEGANDGSGTEPEEPETAGGEPETDDGTDDEPEADDGEAGEPVDDEQEGDDSTEDDVPATEALSSDIREDTTLVAETRYLVTSSISVEARLTIEPGTTIEFEEGADLRINSDGIIDADGTADEKIRFTGTREEPGWWDGIYVRTSESSLNLLNHVVVEYGGRDRPGNVTVGHPNRARSGQRLTITNSTLRNGSQYGLRVFSRTSIEGSGNNVYTENEAPVRISASEVHYLDGESTYTGNENDLVVVDDGDVEADVTVSALDAPYAPRELEVEDGQLTIEAGAELRFREEGRIRVASDGVIVAEGIRGEPVVFSATEEIPGWWDGIYVRSTSLLNRLDFVVVEYGGRDLWGNVQVGRGNRLVNGQLSVTNSTIRHSASGGIIWDGSNSSVNDTVCEVNQFSDNAGPNCGEN